MTKKTKYKGVEIDYDSVKKTFYTKVVINNRYIYSKDVSKVKSQIDKFISSLEDRVFKRAWMSGYHEDGFYRLVDIVNYNEKSNTVTVRDQDLKLKTVSIEKYKYSKNKLFFSNKKNDIIVNDMNSKQYLIDDLKEQKRLIKNRLGILNMDGKPRK